MQRERERERERERKRGREREREGGRERERERTQRERGETVVFTAPTTRVHAEEIETGVTRQKLEVRAEELISSFRFRTHIVPFRPVSNSIKAYTTGFPRHLFLARLLSGRMNGAQWRQEESKFPTCFLSLNTASSCRKLALGCRKGKATRGNTNFQKRFFLQRTSGSLHPRALNLHWDHSWSHFFLVTQLRIHSPTGWKHVHRATTGLAVQRVCRLWLPLVMSKLQLVRRSDWLARSLIKCWRCRHFCIG